MIYIYTSLYDSKLIYYVALMCLTYLLLLRHFFKIRRYSLESS